MILLLIAISNSAFLPTMKSPNSDFSAIPILQPFVDNKTLAGAVVLVATKDRIISHEAVGFADIAAGKPMAKDSFFWIASQTKPMTATALMMLVDEGKVDVCDPVEKYLPEFNGQMVIAEKDEDHVLLKKPSHPITVKEILSHTSGLPFKTPVEEPKLDILPLHSAVRSYAMSPLFSEPGTQYEYSNAGTNTAGRIIEVVSGMSYGEFMQTRVFDPLGMSDTTFVPTEEQTARLAKVYKPGPENTGLVESVISQVTYPLTNPLRQPFPAGGLFSSGRDLVRFCQMILNGGELDGKRYLSTASVQEMIRKQTADVVTKEYGYGWDIADGRFGHGGALATKMTIDPKRGLIMVFLLQHEGFPGDGGQAQETLIQAAVEWVLCRYRHNVHYAAIWIMPRRCLQPL